MTCEEIKENLLKVKEEIFEAEKKSSRKEGSVKLCAVSKFHPAQDVLECLKNGQFLFGENRVQEAYEKFSFVNNSLTSALPAPCLHIIGSLQTNKAKRAAEISSCIQSLDSEKLAMELEKACLKLNKKIDVLLEIHTGEESKAGFRDEKDIMCLLENAEKNLYPHLTFNGLMTMAPLTDDEKIIRKSFSDLRNMKEKLKKNFPDLPLNELSMGMSGDYKFAIEEGSTMVRIGTAIFGQRDYSLSQ